MIPVFFLSWCQAGAQLYKHDARTLALGQCYASSAGLASAALNQAGLGRLEESSSSLHHLRPFITPQLDIISLSAQASLNRGSPGMVLSSMGIFGIASHIVQKKTKEIGIRKVVGASPFQLYKSTLKEFFNSFVIAVFVGSLRVSHDGRASPFRRRDAARPCNQAHPEAPTTFEGTQSPARCVNGI